MSTIAVQTVRQILPDPLLAQMESNLEKIRARAYELFTMRGGAEGRELDDWLQAEKEVGWLPETELQERDNEYLMRIRVPGMQARDISLIAFPTSIVLQADAKRRGEPKLIHRIDFGTPIDPEKVTAKIDGETLQVIATKTPQGAARAA
jgi:HSP20 family molecular chaperone IbpA